MAGVYTHVRKDKNEPFYHGIFEDPYRPFEKSRRNSIWDKIVSKTEYEVVILKENLTWEDACQMEKELIQRDGRIDLGTGCLANMTDGGDGAVGLIRTDEHIRKISESLTGRKLSDEHKKSVSLGHIGKKLSEDTKHKQSIAKKGKKPNNYGKKRSKSAIEGTRKFLFGNLNSAGEKNSKTTLKTEDVIFIKKNWNPDSSEFNSMTLSKKFNISSQSVWAIATNRRWKHVIV